jgi:uncharacterized membrane protein YhhN
MAIWGKYQKKETLHFILKPITTILIIGALMACHGKANIYMWFILGGLACGLFGDVFMMFPDRLFLAGMISFLIGHILYIGAFMTDIHFAITWWPLLIIPLGLIIYIPLHRFLGRMRLPVIIYMIVIMAMAVVAIERWTTLNTVASLAAATGAIIFIISDSVLAYDFFRKPFRNAQAIMLSSYWLAQWLIAMSGVMLTTSPS